MQNGIMDEPPVRILPVGSEEWRFEDGWPPRSHVMRLYLRRGDANPSHSLNDGLLSRKSPLSHEDPDGLSHDPEKPVPSVASKDS